MTPFTSSAVTLDWLNEVLADQFKSEITGFESEIVGGGAGVLGEIARIHLSYAEDTGAPKRIIAKFSSPVAEARAAAGSMSFYEMESRFYDQMAPNMPVRIPRCFYQLYLPDTQEFVLLIEHLDGTVVDQLEGCTLQQAEAAVDTLVHLHAWGAAAAQDYEWLRSQNDPQFIGAAQSSLKQALPITLEKFKDLTPDWLKECGTGYVDRLAELGDEIMLQPNLTVIHGDYRADNLVFDEAGNQSTLDWQIVLRAPGCFDLGYFMSQSLSVELRREHGDSLIARYVAGMTEKGTALDETAIKSQLKLVFVQNLVYPLMGGGMMDESFDRSVKLITTMLSRSCSAVEDYDCVELLR
jgi:hypothetical protein